MIGCDGALKEFRLGGGPVPVKLLVLVVVVMDECGGVRVAGLFA